MFEVAIGKVDYTLSEKMKKSGGLANPYYGVKDIKAGETITTENVHSIRPGFGLHTKYYNEVLGKKAKINLERGPLNFSFIQ